VIAPTRRNRWLALTGLFALPWTVMTYGTELNAIFLWASVATAPPQVLPLPEYLARVGVPVQQLPPRLLGWPLSAALFGLAALVEALSAAVDRDLRGPTAGLVALAGLAHLRVAQGMARTADLAVPVGPLAAFAVAWWLYVAAPPDAREGDRERSPAREGER
jgi:uncharacterized protein (TIGR04206 family)